MEEIKNCPHCGAELDRENSFVDIVVDDVLPSGGYTIDQHHCFECDRSVYITSILEVVREEINLDYEKEMQEEEDEYACPKFAAGKCDSCEKCTGNPVDYDNLEDDEGLSPEQLKQIVDTFKDDNAVEAYVDGSYEHSVLKYGSGVVIVKDDKVIDTISKSGTDESLVSMRNVAGEIEAAKLAMNYCIENNITNLILYYDYEGIEKWCSGSWKTNKEGTKAYKAFYDSISKKLNVDFVKVKAHSGNKYNEEADKLAKKAIQL